MHSSYKIDMLVIRRLNSVFKKNGVLVYGSINENLYMYLSNEEKNGESNYITKIKCIQYLRHKYYNKVHVIKRFSYLASLGCFCEKLAILIRNGMEQVPRTFTILKLQNLTVYPKHCNLRANFLAAIFDSSSLYK